MMWERFFYNPAKKKDIEFIPENSSRLLLNLSDVKQNPHVVSYAVQAKPDVVTFTFYSLMCDDDCVIQ